MSGAAALRVIDAFAPIESAFTDAQRDAILREARAAVAERSLSTPDKPKPAKTASPLPEFEDGLTKWRREGAERAERERVELERDKREQRQRQRQQQRQQADDWRAYLERRFEAEREFLTEAFAELIGELQAKIHKLENELKKK
jgi:hypothetical protein